MKDVKLEDYKAIRNTVELYIAGGRSGESKLMKKAFHEDATIFGWMYPNAEDPTEKTEVAGSIHLLFDFVNDLGPAENLEGEFVRIDIVGTSANVRLELYDWQGIRFTDTLNLIKKGTKWLIVGKIFNQLV